MQAEMFGVVLWADAQDQKAIIWCEDQGNLAYYNASEHANTVHEGLMLDPGDLIQFELRESRDCRKASNPRRVAQSVMPGLADRLRTAADSRRRPEKDTPSLQSGRRDNIVGFPTSVCA